MDFEKKLVASLKASGFSATAPRRAVASALYSYGLQTMSQLIKRCPDVDRASIYRSVKLLEELHVITRVPQGFKHKFELSDNFLPHHHHIVCSGCGRMADIEQRELEELLDKVAESEGYRLNSHKVELIGVCANCN